MHVQLGANVTRFVGVPPATTVGELQALFPVPKATKLPEGMVIQLFADKQLGILIPGQSCGVLRAHILGAAAAPGAPLVLFAGMAT